MEDKEFKIWLKKERQKKKKSSKIRHKIVTKNKKWRIGDNF